jgi:hypothetical protein
MVIDAGIAEIMSDCRCTTDNTILISMARRLDPGIMPIDI